MWGVKFVTFPLPWAPRLKRPSIAPMGHICIAVTNVGVNSLHTDGKCGILARVWSRNPWHFSPINRLALDASLRFVSTSNCFGCELQQTNGKLSYFGIFLPLTYQSQCVGEWKDDRAVLVFPHGNLRRGWALHLLLVWKSWDKGNGFQNYESNHGKRSNFAVAAHWFERNGSLGAHDPGAGLLPPRYSRQTFSFICGPSYS
jgi:hypothetical protein